MRTRGRRGGGRENGKFLIILILIFYDFVDFYLSFCVHVYRFMFTLGFSGCDARYFRASQHPQWADSQYPIMKLFWGFNVLVFYPFLRLP